ncbi:Hypothetical protein D9617_39g039410 [Elsinoe fawcettii]|nr:Hypothetical protein D9617_39g039410 [Elsinoe fawcettii]
MAKRKTELRAEAAERAGTEYYVKVKDNEKDIQSLLRKVLDMAAGLMNTHETTKLLLKASHSLVSKIEDRLKIAIAGTSGQGKSALLNALSHQRSLSRTDSCLEGCTSATCELTGAIPGQTSAYHVLVTFYSREERRSMFTRYVDEYCLLHFSDEDMSIRDETELYRLKTVATTLLQLLLSIMADDESLSTQEHIAALLSKYNEDGTMKAFKTLMLAKCDQLVQDLAADVVIGDAPGISDINQCRERNALEYIDGCDYLLVVFTVQTRLASDGHVDKILKRFRSAFSGKLAMVVTRCDTLHAEAIKMGYAQKVDTYNKLEAEMEEDRIKHENDDESDDDEEARVMAAMMRTRKTEKQMYELAVELRNMVRGAQLKTVKDIDIPVMFVSNLHYWFNVEDRRGSGLVLDLESTGIPELRRFLMGLLESKVHARLIRQLQRFESFTESVRVVAERKKASLSKTTETGMEGFRNDLDEGKAAILEKGRKFRMKRSDLHHGTLRAILVRKGNFRSTYSGHSYDFNSEINDCVKATAELAFHRRETDREGNVKDIGAKRGALFIASSKTFIGNTQGKHWYWGESHQQHWSYPHKDHAAAIDESKEHMDRLDRTISLQVLQAGNPMYSERHMASFYEKAIHVSGTGYKDEILRLLLEHMQIAHGNVFGNILSDIANDLQNGQAELIARLEKALDQNLQDYRSKLTGKFLQGQQFQQAKAAAGQFLLDADGMFGRVRWTLGKMMPQNVVKEESVVGGSIKEENVSA